MAAPAKVWTVLPVVLTSASPVTIVYYTDEIEAQKAAVRQSIASGVQYYHFEAVNYIEPEIPDVVLTALVHPLP